MGRRKDIRGLEEEGNGYKTGGITECGNSRCISLSSVLGKVFCKGILQCFFIVCVIVHVSAPYSRTDSTVAINSTWIICATETLK